MTWRLCIVGSRLFEGAILWNAGYRLSRVGFDFESYPWRLFCYITFSLVFLSFPDQRWDGTVLWFPAASYHTDRLFLLSNHNSWKAPLKPRKKTSHYTLHRRSYFAAVPYLPEHIVGSEFEGLQNSGVFPSDSQDFLLVSPREGRPYDLFLCTGGALEPPE